MPSTLLRYLPATKSGLVGSKIQKSPRIYHGPSNIGGIGRYLADWQRKHGAVSDFITFLKHPRKDIHHLCLDLPNCSFWKRQLVRMGVLLLCIGKYDIFNFYFGTSLLQFNLDLPILRLLGKKIVMVYCGSDIRLVEVEKERNPYWHLLKTSLVHPRLDGRKKRMMLWHNLWVDRVIAIRDVYANAARIISKEKIIKDLWVNNTFDLDAYCPQEYHTATVPLIVHAPTEPEIKGTRYIENAIDALRQVGHKFEYRRVQGLTHAEAEHILRNEADIVVDQFLIGAPGQLVFEAMYFGKPVVTYLIPSIKDEFHPDIPIVSATIDNLTEKLAWLIQHPEERERIGREGRRFVEKYCNREEINRRLWSVYEEL